MPKDFKENGILNAKILRVLMSLDNALLAPFPRLLIRLLLHRSWLMQHLSCKVNKRDFFLEHRVVELTLCYVDLVLKQAALELFEGLFAQNLRRTARMPTEKK